MDAVSQESNELSAKRIALQNTFKEYNEKNGFSYEEWVNPPAGSFYEGYKKELDEINDQMAPPLTYQS
ncbi:MAG: hypothetical protein HN828_04385 [Candidatus Thioglobus sp.]|jgi:hypothetical protein|uniref:hypothetical protein n=1 Tax=Candidatus Thioglobus sp. TaxID=2026721 RepID=UPI0001BD394B|nr:hypothetical protein [Candidatus Thioglobus sp.]EEZ79615.1 MAG: hypothetical protein Sup05_0945 [uncultured Candidatus Thioglobus sp.]MBT3186416.1 hypothetical protein [Candidatus Thioglobus sp.]MBT3432034.1 hypothetical protein [Candidatus Thioglobus sp.]MBT3964911.1 hypothetical protein [Candidatus Thioglobus sp.]MBT4316202.1 hypothetical protein [Candidatus Thioglobus sp.]